MWNNITNQKTQHPRQSHFRVTATLGILLHALPLTTDKSTLNEAVDAEDECEELGIGKYLRGNGLEQLSIMTTAKVTVHLTSLQILKRQ